MRKSTMLLVISVLLIISPLLSIIDLIVVASTYQLSDFYYIISIAFIGFHLYAGITGAANHANPEKAKKCIIIGIILLAIRIVNLIISITTGILNAANVSFLSLILGFIIPVLYIYSACKLTYGGDDEDEEG